MQAHAICVQDKAWLSITEKGKAMTTTESREVPLVVGDSLDVHAGCAGADLVARQAAFRVGAGSSRPAGTHAHDDREGRCLMALSHA
jgi:hypothetical protein